ncbi:MAG TPA: 7-carboxy-7-deazaguanine synthase QueE [Alphaproteobacteria bacterium]|nr:7-carboxy-7-deazaguanine synthase QueE [Alphaproteobacteria bacterium]
MNDTSANIVEIFSSIQGEGMLVGLRQIFLRFHGCTLECSYCDTRKTLSSRAPETCQVEKVPGRQKFIPIKNPVSTIKILDLLNKWTSGFPNAHHSISLTGGEPLLQDKFLKNNLVELRKILPIYLETNGVLHAELAHCIDFMDYISMDFKLPSTTKSRPYWDEHRKFLALAAQRQVYVKAVVSNDTSQSEIRQASEIIYSVNRNIPLILQPLTSGERVESLSSEKLFQLQETATKWLTEVRVIPQTHKYLHLL